MVFLKLKILKHPLFWLFIILMVGGVAFGRNAYIKQENIKLKNTLEEITVVVEKENFGVKVQGSGTVEPIKSVNVSPKNPGILNQLLVEQGDFVNQGQVLAVMENAQLQAQIAQAQANLNRALANLEQGQIRITSEINQSLARVDQTLARLEEIEKRKPKDVDQAVARVAQAQSRLNLAIARVDRYEYLEKQGAVTSDRLDEAINEYNTAKANLEDNQEQLTQIQQTMLPEIAQQKAVVSEAQITLKQKQANANKEKQQLQAEVASAQAQLKQVEIQFKDTIITAPFDGIVTQKFATEGAFVTPTTSASSTASATSTSILALAQGLEIIAKVPEIDMPQLALNQDVEITADAFPDELFTGKVKRIAPEAILEQNVTSFEVVITLLSGQEKLRSKMNVDVIFIGENISNTLVVPTVAIVTKQGQTGVLLSDQNGNPNFKPLTLGLTLEDKTQVLQGLSPGDRVFIDLPQGYSIEEGN
jgi:HlyD family secretion protein